MATCDRQPVASSQLSDSDRRLHEAGELTWKADSFMLASLTVEIPKAPGERSQKMARC